MPAVVPIVKYFLPGIIEKFIAFMVNAVRFNIVLVAIRVYYIETF